MFPEQNIGNNSVNPYILFWELLIWNRLLIYPYPNKLFQEQVIGNSILLCYSQFTLPGTIIREQVIAKVLHIL